MPKKERHGIKWNEEPTKVRTRKFREKDQINHEQSDH
jgi:hypothetical protein